MGTEKTEDRLLAPPLNDIKDIAVMLDIASEYLCEEPFLKKIGSVIVKSIGALEDLIEDVKKQYVGKPVGEIDLSRHIKPLAQFAERLQKVEKSIKSACTEGRLGKQLTEKILPLADEFNAYKDRLEGKFVAYTTGDSVSGLIGNLKLIGSSIVATYKLFMKICGVLILVCLMAFPFLYISMEKEENVLERIDEAKEVISSKQAHISKVEADYNEVKKKVSGIRQDALNRQEIVNLIDLNLNAYKLSEEMQGALIDIKIKEKALEDELKRLEEMQRKSFLSRLLRL